MTSFISNQTYLRFISFLLCSYEYDSYSIFRKRKGYNNPILPQESNASTSNMNGNLSPRTRKQCYIKKKDSNGLATPNLAQNRPPSLTEENENKNKNDDNKTTNEAEGNELYNHLHEESGASSSQKNNDYASVNLENKEYSTCGGVTKNNEILRDGEYGTSNDYAETSKSAHNGKINKDYDGEKEIDTNQSGCVASKSENSIRDNLDDDQMTTNSTTKDPESSVTIHQRGIHEDAKTETSNKVKYKKEPVTNRDVREEEGEMIVDTDTKEDVKSRKALVKNKIIHEGKTTESRVDVDSNDNAKSSNAPVVNNRDINKQIHFDAMAKSESIYSNVVDEDNNEYGNWNGVAVHNKQMNTFIPDNDEIYSNTASIYSNNIQEDIYSNDTSVL
jgi:hypothetical protein